MEAGTLRLAKDGLCALCYAKATMLCSKCKQRWYCSAEHQAKDWLLGHKGDCGLADLPLAAAVPAPPAGLRPESVERPVLGEAAWRRLLEGTEAGPRAGPPRGLRNLGNTCYMNAVLQGLYHAAPPVVAACQEHQASRCGGRGSCSSGTCFRCDLESVSSNCMDPRPQEPAAGGAGPSSPQDFRQGDRVVLQALEREDLNGLEGIVLAGAAAGAPPEEARCSVQLPGQQGKKAVRQQNLALRSRAPTAPSDVARWLTRLGAEFTFGMQEDAHEFMRSLLRLVEDEELKEHAESLRKRGSEEGSAPAPNADLTASPNRVFGGLTVSQCTCTNRQCAASSFSFERFMDLSLDITEATDSVEDALRLFTAPERLDKKNGWRCESCNETVRARKQITIYTAPSVLVLHLKRFRYGERGKVTRPVAFSAELNLRPYLCAGAQEAGKPLLYELRAVVVHLDKAGYSHFGHYIAYVRCAPAPGAGGPAKWYLLDDSQASEVPEAEVLRQQAYILLYASAEALPAVRKGAGVDVAPVENVALPSKCRGRNGEVCTFFACSDGLCTRCYQEEHGKPPPAAPSAEQASPAAVAAPKKAAASGKSGAGSAGRPASGKAPAPGAAAKAKKVGANDQCPCGSGKKYKKCHGATA